MRYSHGLKNATVIFAELQKAASMHPEDMAQAFALMNILERNLGFASGQDVKLAKYIVSTILGL